MTFNKVFFGLLLLVTGAAQIYAAAPETTWAQPATRLAKEIANIAGPGTAALTVSNQSTIPESEVPAIRRAIEAQLRVNGIALRSAENAATTVNVTLSENLQGWVWVAGVQQGSEVRVAIIPVERVGSVTPTQPGPTMTLKKTFVFAQPTPILDFSTIHAGSETHLVVLDGSNVSLYRSTGSKYELEEAFPIVHSRAYPRDLRGRLAIGKDHLFDAYLPGVMCSSSATTPITVTCRESDDPWPLSTQRALYNSARNYFTGALAPGIGKPLSPFFTAADLPRSNYALWIFTAVDGSVRESDGMNERRVTSASDWGSDIAAVHDTCGLGTQVLVSAAGDGSDSLRAFEVPDREPVLVSSALGFDFPITALWTSMDTTTANAVVHNTTGGRYEAYSVSVACGQ
ncbi:MAG TPA: hypothetical protein VGL89_16115 [Candidatus Koribacter sp.]